MNLKPLRYAITDRRFFSGSGLVLHAARLAADGVDFLQLREKDLPAGELASLARSLRRTLLDSGVKLLINARADIAVATAAHGVHLTSSPDELKPRQIIDLYTMAQLPAPIVTISCHSLEDVVRHRLEPVSAILFGPVFEKSVAGETVGGGTGLALLRQACAAAAPVPVLALGGITAANTDACLEAGARGVAGIRLFQGGVGGESTTNL